MILCTLILVWWTMIRRLSVRILMISLRITSMLLVIVAVNSKPSHTPRTGGKTLWSFHHHALYSMYKVYSVAHQTAHKICSQNILYHSKINSISRLTYLICSGIFFILYDYWFVFHNVLLEIRNLNQ